MFLNQLISLQSFKPSRENKKKGRRFNGACKEFGRGGGRFGGRGGRGGGSGFGGHGGRGGGGFGGRVGGDTRVRGGRSR